MQMMAGMTPVASDNTQTSNANVTSEAIYWQGTYAVNDKLNATLGVRKSDDESDYSIAVGTTSPGIPFVQVPGQWSEVLTFGSTDPKFVLDYTFNNNSMAYISFASGYKSGGFSFATWAESESRGGFTEEELDNIPFNADLVKEIFKHNKRFEIGWMKINPKGLITFAFKFGDLETNYYLVRNQNQ